MGRVFHIGWDRVANSDDHDDDRASVRQQTKFLLIHRIAVRQDVCGEPKPTANNLVEIRPTIQ